MEYLVFPMVILAVLWALASLANNWEAMSKGEPLGTIRQKELCRMHSWRKATFLNFKDFEAYKQDPTKFEHLKTDYCTDCGFVPQFDKMVVPKFLAELREAAKQQQLREQKERDFLQLRDEFLKIFLEERRKRESREGEDLIKLGYDAYDSFLCALPELMQTRELSRILGALEDKKI